MVTRSWVSPWLGHSSNEVKLPTLAVSDAVHAEPETEVTFVWGEEGGGTTKPTVEPHVQTEIKAVVSPVPYVETIRREYAPTGCALSTTEKNAESAALAGAAKPAAATAGAEVLLLRA